MGGPFIEIARDHGARCALQRLCDHTQLPITMPAHQPQMGRHQTESVQFDPHGTTRFKPRQVYMGDSTMGHSLADQHRIAMPAQTDIIAGDGNHGKIRLGSDQVPAQR